jgi:organic hydroperoxide reductase OsmC/OhrA
MGDRTHRYRATCRWEGSTAVGYEAYDRAHVATSPPAAERLQLSSDPAFLGDPTRMNPESLLLVAAASCQMLSFLAVAARARIDVIDYEDDAEAVMPEAVRPVQITEIRLRPRITVRPPATERRVRDLAELAHRECFIANSLRSQISVAPTVTILVGPESE